MVKMYTRKDKQTTMKVMALEEDRALVEVKWNKGRNTNILYLKKDYIQEKYGVSL